MGIEKGSLPEKNQLPLDVQDSRVLAAGGESQVWSADVKDSNARERRIALKENRKEVFATDEEMQHSKSYYDYLKAFAGFGKFVPSTLYFKARMQEGDEPRSYALQELLPGKTVNRFDDAELYKDPEVVKQLAEFVDGAIAILQATRQDRKTKPDFGKSSDDDAHGTHMANVLLNPRYSNNILITDGPDETGRRVFFVDTGENVRERTQPLWNLYQRQVVGRIQETRLESWKKEINNHLQQKNI